MECISMSISIQNDNLCFIEPTKIIVRSFSEEKTDSFNDEGNC